MPRQHYFGVRISGEERDMLLAVAAKLDCSESKVFRHMLVAAARQLNVLPPERLAGLELKREEVQQSR